MTISLKCQSKTLANANAAPDEQRVTVLLSDSQGTVLSLQASVADAEGNFMLAQEYQIDVTTPGPASPLVPTTPVLEVANG